MPSSLHYHISNMVDWIVKIQPQSILDIGAGFGKWGFLSREYTDVSANRYDPSNWQVRIDGVEAFLEYLTPVHNYIYDSIYTGDVRAILPNIPDYDLIIIGNVIEHFDKPDGIALLHELRRKRSYVLLSSPTVFFEQSLFGNGYETHRSFWNVCDFATFQFNVELDLDGWACHQVHTRRWLKQRPKLAQISRKLFRRVPSQVRKPFPIVLPKGRDEIAK